MTISSQGVTSFDLRQTTKYEGQPSAFPKPLGNPYANPKRRQLTRLTFGGTPTDGTYSALLQADGYSGTLQVTRTGGVPATNADLAAALILAAGAAPFRGVIKSAVAGPNPEDVDITFLRPGYAFEVTPSAPGAGTLAASLVTSSAGASIPVGRWLTIGTLDGVSAAILPSASTTAAEIRGASLRPLTMLSNPDDINAAGELVYRPGKQLTVAYEVTIAMVNRGSVAATVGGQVFVVRNTAGGQSLGVSRADADGGNTIALDVSRVYWLEPTAPGAIGDVRVIL
ncbi:MAG: hypothetical protein KC457_00910 [Myxococcales bacterium]|nr:hypothetical protein [Myxococcales bacterium]